MAFYSQFDELAETPASTDIIPLQDVSDTTDNAAGTTKKIQYSNLVPTASATVAGVSELAVASEVNAGTDTVRSITPDALAGSNFAIRYVAIPVTAVGGDISTGDNKAYFKVQSGLNGMNLVSVDAEVSTAPDGAAISIQVHNATDTADMLSTALTIDDGETGSDTAATAAVIDGTADDVATNDVIRIDVDQVGSSTAGAGLLVTLGFQPA